MLITTTTKVTNLVVGYGGNIEISFTLVKFKLEHVYKYQCS